MASFVTDNYKLDITPQGNYPVVYMSQFENGRQIRFRILNRGISYAIPSGVSAFVSGLKSNGGYYEHICEIDGSRRYVVMPVESDMTDINGKGVANIVFTNGSSEKVISAKFITLTQRTVVDDGIEVPTEAETVFQQLLNEIRASATEIDAGIDGLQAELQSSINNLQAELESGIEGVTEDTTNAINTLTARMNTFIAEQDGNYNTSTVLWDMTEDGDGNGILGKDTTVTLRYRAADYDYLDIYSFNKDLDSITTIPVDENLDQNGYAVRSINVGSGNVAKFRAVEYRLQIVGTTLTIAESYAYWYDTSNHAEAITQANKSQFVGVFGISKIVGRKMVHDSELVDVRVGADGTIYSTAGAAVRAQVQALNNKTASNIPYSNTNSGLSATNVQAAIDENAEGLAQTNGRLGDLKTDLNEVNAFIDWSVKTGLFVRASDGKYVASSYYNSYEYPVYGLSKIYLTPYFTNSTYGYAFYDKSKTFIANSGGTYDVATRTEITVPNGAYYIRFTENTTASKPKLEADWGLMLETKADIKETKDHFAELYADAYNVTNYIPTDGLAVVGKYYDSNGRLQTASNLSTTGIISVQSGIKDIYYNAYRNITIPTILFFDASMQIVGTVIATTAPAYGDTNYSGYAEIPSTAKYMEASMNNTIAGQIVTVRYSKVDNNVARITALETDPLYGKKITCTGDSITAATHSYPGHSYVDQIAQAHGMTVNNKAIWGAVFAQNQVDGQGNARGCIYDTIALMDADADIVIISGGINDLEYHARAGYWGSITPTYEDTLDTETFCGALEGICKTALQKWSGKPIIFVFEHRMTIDSTTYGSFFKNTEYALMIQIFQKWGIPYVDLYHDMPSLSLNAGYKEAYTTGDGTHPNIAGYAKFYVPRVYSKIKEVMGI